MKRKLLAIGVVIALLVSVYTGYAYFSTRGLQIYLMGTRWGAIFNSTWQITFLAGVILWIPGIVTLVRKLSKLGKKAVKNGSVDPTEILPGTDPTEMLEPQKGSVPLTQPLVVPGRDVDTEATELLEPRKGQSGATEHLEPCRGEEDITSQKESESLSPVVMPQPAGTTELLGPRKGDTISQKEVERSAPVAEPIKSMEKRQEQEKSQEPVKFCPNCGYPVAGKRFCAKCGTRVG